MLKRVNDMVEVVVTEKIFQNNAVLVVEKEPVEPSVVSSRVYVPLVRSTTALLTAKFSKHRPEVLNSM